jgi:hypothetical protein
VSLGYVWQNKIEGRSVFIANPVALDAKVELNGQFVTELGAEERTFGPYPNSRERALIPPPEVSNPNGLASIRDLPTSLYCNLEEILLASRSQNSMQVQVYLL